MKVTTDGCLFGAVAANEISSYQECHVLDIGTGTGLLSLMTAQQNRHVSIDAIEIDIAAAQQATENITASPWAEQIQIIQDDIMHYAPDKLYDVVISNPPFYEKQLTSPELGRQQAHHSSSLSLQQLLQQVKRLLKQNGNFFLMVPFYRNEETILLAKQFDFRTQKQWLIKQTPKHNWFRSIICFSYQNIQPVTPMELCIKDEDNNYSSKFTDLLKPYYLNL